MSKLDYLQQKKLTQADELREILNRLEEALPQLKGLEKQQAQALLLDLDRADELFHQLEAAGLDLRSEEVRFHSLQARLQKQAGSLLPLLGGPSAFAMQRPTPAPPSEKWWWYLDQIVAVRQRQGRRRLMFIGVAILAVVGLAIVLFQTVLAPSPEVLARLEAENNALEAIAAGRPGEALTFVQQGLSQAPHEPELWLLQGIIQEMLADQTAATASFDRAQVQLDEPLNFYLSRSQLYLSVDQPARAERDARAAIERAGDSAAAWFVLGQTLEFQDKLAEALSAYQKANDLALAHGNSEILVLARMALARVGGRP